MGLPAKTENVFNYLIKQRSRPPKNSVINTIRAQADRTGWKILSDWIDIQISMIEVDQAESIEMFLAYTYDPVSNLTLFGPGSKLARGRKVPLSDRKRSFA